MIALPLSVSVPLSGVALTFPIRVVIRERCFCVLHSEVFILATSPQGFHFIVIIWVCVGVAINRISEVHLISNDAIAALSEELILFVKLPLILSDGNIKAFLFEVRLLLFSYSGLLQHLFSVSETSLPGALHWRLRRWRWWRKFFHCWSSPGVIRHERMWSTRRSAIR